MKLLRLLQGGAEIEKKMYVNRVNGNFDIFRCIK